MSKQTPKTRTIEVFKAGTLTSSSGQQITFTAEQLAAMAANYDAENSPAPIVVGHPAVDAPAFGWAAGFSFNAEDQKLRADLGDMSPSFVSAVQEGRYKKVSMALFPPDHPANPTPGDYYPRHIGFLGGAAPAVPGLKPIHFDDGGADTAVVLEFDAPDFSDPSTAQSIGAQIIDYLKTVAGIGTPARTLFSARSAAKPGETEMSQADKDKLAQLEQENATLKANQAKAAAAARVTDATNFAAALVTAKKLAPKDQAAVAAALAALPEAEVEFAAEGNTTVKESPLAVMKRVLEAKSPIIKTDTAITPPAATTTVAGAGPQFSAPSGQKVDQTQQAIWAAAKKYQAEHKGVTFSAAVQAVTAAADTAAQV